MTIRNELIACELLDVAGRRVRLAELLGSRRTVVVFLRHYG